ncbi:hypothetical protein K6V98_00750 [Collinsella sp. AGMB00827]|uniref:Alcohol dehydrogenase-like C-terminal domain-containing protein n=1 Tax=Collinsella ureilytica TaxID=2869515 RepID=A0ABS7MII0_9ACTN|nr:hypothetical protein [Collinsella urealyticum]MBY4796896.1 hypothetical protein [Collinsella urealyticum]
MYEHEMGIREGGKLAIVAGAGPMGLGALTYALHCDRRPGLVVGADIDQSRLDRAAELFPPAEVKEETGIDLIFVNNGELEDQAAGLRELSGGTGFDDVLCYAPVASVVTLSAAILGRDGCLNFFAEPTDKEFSTPLTSTIFIMDQPMSWAPRAEILQTKLSHLSSPLLVGLIQPLW